MEPLAEIFARRLHVHQQRNVAAEIHPVFRRDLDARVARHGDQVRLGIGRTADGRNCGDGIEKRFARENFRRAQIFVRELDDAAPRFVGNLAAFAIGRGNRRAAGQRQAEHFGDRVHRRRRAHRVAVAQRWRRSRGRIEELLFVDLARGELAARTPDDGAGPDEIAIVPAVEHRPSREHDGRNIDGRCRHDLCRRGLVASGREHHGIDGIAVQDLHESEIGEIAIERRGRPAAVLENRMQREFHRHAAGVADAFAHALHRLEMHAIARREIAAGLRDADDRFSRQQFIGGQAVVHEALEIQRHHVEMFRVVEPIARAEAALLRGSFVRCHATRFPVAVPARRPARGTGRRRAVAAGVVLHRARRAR